MMSRHEKHLNSYTNTKRLHLRPSGASNSRLPDEILLKIFRYLSPSCLLLCAQVCQRWSVLTRESSLWQALLLFLPKEVRDSLSFEETRQVNFDWKREIIQRCTNTRNKKAFALCRKVSVYTGLPANTVQALRFAGVTWSLCVTDTSGNYYWVSADDVTHFSASSSVRWYSLQLPPITKLTAIQVFAFVPVFFHRNWKPHIRSSSTRSLIIKLDLRSQGSKLLRSTAASESDMITVHITSPSMLVSCWSASWKDDGEIAFVTVSLHHHNLIRKILKGSHDRTFVPQPHRPVLDDVDPEYGLHGYSATVELRNHKVTLWGRQYRQLYQQHVSDDVVCFGGYSQAEHGSFQKKLSLPWKTELFKNILPDMCFLDATVLDDQKKPLWCVSSPVKIFANKVPDVNYSAEGERLFMEYKDEHGSIRLDFLWIEDEELTQVTNVEFRILKSFVNSWFGTSY